MRVRVQREQTLLVTTELVIWRYANAFIFTNQSELDFGIALVVIGAQQWTALFPSVGRPLSNWVDIYILALGPGNVFYWNRNT